MIYNQGQAKIALAEWQKILKLQDWDVKIDILRYRGLRVEGQAEVTWTIENKQAIIHLLDPIDYENKYFPQDHEVSLVHELLHLHMAMFNAVDDTPENIAQEQAICAISEELVELKRMGHKPPIAMVRGDNGAEIELPAS